ncbi:hypothetical protein HNQ80_002561 [Anaerosolibacter carboniphilus]|uniref:CAAX prenyl protease 2/Lysostaphin resistance protein A-like domain-containing protein n=1 Tax=Anaerosolibacter carboniphilus TaxID=1417629 RepID=A0A841L241_9FIRM|nr:type II CAAX endopeptidase family protein [Anaerosolibacter carboniphilus]MBB6216459.1 hypothetical protein [Anaerosolibacter carboniphilus]
MEESKGKIPGFTVIGSFLFALLVLAIQSGLYIPFEIAAFFPFFNSNPNSMTFLQLAEELFVFLIVLLYLNRYAKKRFSQGITLGGKPSLKTCLYILLLMVGYNLFIDNTLMQLLKDIPPDEYLIDYFEELSVSPIVLILLVVITGPIYEEILYRGIIMKGLLLRNKPWVAVVTSSIIFGLIHLNIHQGLNAFIIGLIFGFIYLKTDSLIPSIVMHIFNNFIAVSELLYFDGNFNLVALIIGSFLLILSLKYFISYKTISEANFASQEEPT